MVNNSVVQRKKKFNWKLWIVLFFVAIIIGYYIGGIFCFPDLSLENVTEKLEYILKHPFNNYLNEKTKATVLIVWIIYLVGLSYAFANLKNYMPGKEMGSAKWGEPKQFNKLLKDPDPKKENMILSKNLRKAYDTKRTLLNNNITCVGGSGAGKTAGFVAPNILEMHGSNVYTDPKGDTLKDFGPALIDAGIRVRVINLCEMHKSHRYNPFKYVRKLGDLRRLLTNILANTTPADANKGDPFWDKAETLYLMGVFSYVWLECDDVPYYKYIQIKKGQNPEYELAGCVNVEEIAPRIWRGVAIDDNGEVVRLQKTFRTVLKLLDEAAVSDDEDRMSELDCRMEDLRIRLLNENQNPSAHPAIRNYNRAIRGAGDTVRSIIISANARFAPFDDEELLSILDGDDIDLPSLGIGVNGDKKTRTSLFCVIPDDDTTYNFVPGMLYTQMYQELYRVARQFGNKLPIEVGCWFDEFANIKMPNDFEKILATCRSRNIYIVIILQSLAQIKDLYKDKWEGLVGNCDTVVYLGGNEQSSHKYFSEQLGKWTIDKRTTGETLGSHGSSSRNYDILGRELMTPDEIKNMPNKDSLIFVRGQDPIYDEKMYWFKQKKWDYIKNLEEYQFIPIENAAFEFLDEEAVNYMKNDNTKDVVEYSFSGLSGFLGIDLNAAAERSEKEIQQQIKEIEKGLIEVSTLDAVVNTDEGEKKEESLEDIMVNNLNSEQIKALTDAIVNGVPDDVVKELALKKVSPERINLITGMYKR